MKHTVRSKFHFDTLPERLLPVLIVAVWDLDGEVSVTNDAENVIKWLLLEVPHMNKNTRVIYRDSTNLWDELLHDGEKFTDFRLMRVSDLEEALGRTGYDRQTRRLTERVG